VREKNGASTIKQLENDVLTVEKKQKIIRILDIHSKDLFFSRSALLIEGPTEFAAMPIFSRSYGKDFDLLGVSVVEAGGSDFGELIDVLEAFGFSYIAMCDKDAVMTIIGRIDYESEKIKVGRLFSSLEKRIEKADLKLLKNFQLEILPATNERKQV
jgi:predicted ATP-dependent endonuclease of OLD family